MSLPMLLSLKLNDNRAAIRERDHETHNGIEIIRRYDSVLSNCDEEDEEASP